MMTNARNLQLHVSFNGMGNSECDIELDTIFNSSVHLSFQVGVLLLILHNMSANFQNPKNTPVTLNMKKAELTNIHVSQNVPQRSPMEVKIDGAVTCQIQLAQSVPMSSPLTWELVGDPGEQQHSGRRESERDHLLSSYIQKSHGISSERIGIRTGT